MWASAGFEVRRNLEGGARHRIHGYVEVRPPGLERGAVYPAESSRRREGAMSGTGYTLVSLPNEQQATDQVRKRLRESRASGTKVENRSAGGVIAS